MTEERPIEFVCKECQNFTVSELAKWQRYYLQGEGFVEVCSHCGAGYSVTITSVRNPALDRALV